MISAAALAAELGLPEPTDEQAAVIEAPLAPSLVVAGAGSGKTETMAARVVYLVATGQVRPGQVLGLTFTRKAAGELAERVRSRLRALHRHGLVAAEPQPVPVSTYHSYAASVLGDHGLRLGVEPGRVCPFLVRAPGQLTSIYWDRRLVLHGRWSESFLTLTASELSPI